jgi:hypothetical protein
MVIPAMDELTKALKNANNLRSRHPAIVGASNLAYESLNRYYSLTDSSSVYRIAMVLDPGMKLQYFHEHGWKNSWIKRADSLVRTTYETNYEKETITTTTSVPEPTSMRPFSRFGIRSATTHVAVPVSELQEYLGSAPQIVKDEDVLNWWVKNKDIYPNLHRMALDYLSIPGFVFVSFLFSYC